MEFDTYQTEALRTDRVPDRDDGEDSLAVIVPMLGLAGETGQLLSEYKKHLRDGDAHRLFGERVSEELGDLLWYVANVASKFGLSLNDIAAANLLKVRARWLSSRTDPLCFDARLPEGERLPRRFEVELLDAQSGARRSVRVLIDGEPFWRRTDRQCVRAGRIQISRHLPFRLCPRFGLVTGHARPTSPEAQEPSPDRRG